MQASSLQGVLGDSRRPVFKPYRSSAETSKSRRRLPHWDRAGATQYVTFRLIDSVPQLALERWNSEREDWLKLRGVDLGESDRLQLDLLTVDHRREYMQRFGAWFQDELDRCHGECILRASANRAILESALHYFDGQRYDLGDYVIMPNHVHVLLVPYEGEGLSGILKSWKQHASMKINARTGGSGALWQAERFDHIVRSRKQLERIRDYIRANGEVAGLGAEEFTHRAQDWEFEDDEVREDA